MSPFPLNCWYVAAWSHEVPSSGLFHRTILGQPVLLYRLQTGEAVALDNRCCHRAAPLHLGRQEGDNIRCGYHGMLFNPQGACLEVPGQTTIPREAQIRRYPLVERNNWLWLWPGPPEQADPALIPDNWACNHPDWRYVPDTHTWPVDWRLICDNLLDFSHLSYVHAATLGGSTEIAQAKPVIDRIPGGLRVTRRVRDVPPAPYHRRFADLPGNVDRWFIYEFLLPGILLMHSGLKPTGHRWDEMQGALRLESCQALTPETADSTHYFFMQAPGFGHTDPDLPAAIHASLIQAFAEDRAMITAQQAMLKLGPSPMVAIAADAALARFRQILQRALQAEGAPLPDDGGNASWA